MRVGLVCCARLENRYIREFVDYYLNLGFDQIIICDNNHNNEEHFEDILQYYINKELVVIYDYRNQDVVQLFAYNEIYNQISDKFDWIFICDIDEFLVLTDIDNNVKEYLSRDCFKDFNQILINWKIYSDNNLIHYDNRPCLERFTEEAIVKQTNESDDNCICNCFIRGGLENIMCYIHNFDGEILNETTCNDNGDKLSPQQFNNVKNYELAYVKHFLTKTIDEYINHKRLRGVGNMRIDYMRQFYDLDKFFKYNEVTPEKIQYAKEHGMEYKIDNEENNEEN